MYYYEKFKFKIPEEYDGRGIVTGQEKDFILKMRREGKGFGEIHRITKRSYNTLYRICEPDKYEVLKQKAKASAQRKREGMTKEQKIFKNKQNRETVKKRIGLLREILKDQLPKNARRFSEGRTYKVNTKNHANL